MSATELKVLWIGNWYYSRGDFGPAEAVAEAPSGQHFVLVARESSEAETVGPWEIRALDEEQWLAVERCQNRWLQCSGCFDWDFRGLDISPDGPGNTLLDFYTEYPAGGPFPVDPTEESDSGPYNSYEHLPLVGHLDVFPECPPVENSGTDPKRDWVAHWSRRNRAHKNS